jgi:hypothetical protein
LEEIHTYIFGKKCVKKTTKILENADKYPYIIYRCGQKTTSCLLCLLGGRNGFGIGGRFGLFGTAYWAHFLNGFKNRGGVKGFLGKGFDSEYSEAAVYRFWIESCFLDYFRDRKTFHLYIIGYF